MTYSIYGSTSGQLFSTYQTILSYSCLRYVTLEGPSKSTHILPNALKPSVARPSLMFLASFANHSYFLSNSFHASPSAGWLSSFSTGFLFNLCHCASAVVFFGSNYPLQPWNQWEMPQYLLRNLFPSIRIFPS